MSNEIPNQASARRCLHCEGVQPVWFPYAQVELHRQAPLPSGKVVRGVTHAERVEVGLALCPRCHRIKFFALDAAKLLQDIPNQSAKEPGYR